MFNCGGESRTDCFPVVNLIAFLVNVSSTAPTESRILFDPLRHADVENSRLVLNGRGHSRRQ